NSRPRGLAPILTLCVVMPFLSLTAYAQSRSLYMPVLQSADSIDSQLTLVNPAVEPATVTLIARSYAGAVLSGPGIINPVSLTLAPSSSRALRARELFGDGVSSGWVELQTTSDAISGAFSVFDSKQNSIDASDLNITPSSRLIFPTVTTDASSGNMLVLINTSDQRISQISVSLFENSGSLVAQRTFSLPAFSGFSGGIAALVPAIRDFDGYAVVDADSSQNALIGFETYRDRADIAALEAIPDDARLRTGYLSQFGNQPNTVSTLALVNYGNGSQTIAITAAITEVNGKGGNPASTTVQRTLSANERVELQLDQLFNFNSARFIVAYVKFQGSEGVFAYLESKTPAGGLTAIPAQATGYSDISFSSLANSRLYTGLTLMSSSAPSTLITIDAFDQRGYPIDTATLTLAANTRWSGLLSDLLPETQDQGGGRVHITASSLILAIQILGSASSGALAVVPAQGSALPAQISSQPVSSSAGAIVSSSDGSASLA